MKYQSKFGLSNYVGVWMNRIFWSAIIIMAIFNFNENREGLTILITILTIFVSRIKTDHYTVTDTAIVVTRKFFFDLLPVVTLIPKDRLREIQIQGNRTIGTNILLNLLPFAMRFVNRISFILNDGKIKSFRTEVYLDQLEGVKVSWKK